MQTPPCPACGTPLRPFPEMNAWGCDRCQQMLPAGPPPAGGGFQTGAPGQRTQAEKTRTMILAGALVVAVIGVGIMLATDDKGSEESEESDVAATAEATEPETPATPPAKETPPPAKVETTPPPAAATTPKGSPINIPECAEVAVLRGRVAACAAIPENEKTLLFQDADNKMSVFDTAPPSGDYAEMVRGKCAGTARSLSDSLAQHQCK